MKYLYVIGAKEGPVKIGLSSDPSYRLQMAQTYYPYELAILGQCPITRMAAFADEARVHKAFAREHLRGEWFERSPRVFEFIKQLRAAYPLETALNKCFNGHPPRYLTCDRDETL